MMWLVRLLRRPISVAAMAVLMLVFGTLSFFLMNIDIFPAINVPVVMVVWNYPGMASLDMERRMIFISERACSTTVNGIDHIESESMLGVGLLKIYAHHEAGAIVRENRLHLAAVHLGHDNGIDVVVSGDVHDGYLVAMSVGQAVSDGAPVQPVRQHPGKS